MANNSWGTPPHFIESARKVMGSIDVDPASNDEAQYIVQAGQYFTEDDSGLDQYWNGNVWLNPPYGRGLAKPFIRQIVHQYKVVKCVTQAIVLLNSVYSSAWWKESEIAVSCSAICLPDHRIAFINPVTGKPEKGNDREQIITYIGDNPNKFCEEFSQYGLCCLPYQPLTFI
tara:strand:+ start:61 stop:576 length:516 start_codon:yes stop_codon:yes gene_type:complete